MRAKRRLPEEEAEAVMTMKSHVSARNRPSDVADPGDRPRPMLTDKFGGMLRHGAGAHLINIRDDRRT